MSIERTTGGGASGVHGVGDPAVPAPAAPEHAPETEPARAASMRAMSSGFSASLLQDRLRAASGGSSVEGGGAFGTVTAEAADTTRPRDLSTRAGVTQLLSQWGQVDRSADTVTDGVRCQSNTAIAGLLMNDAHPPQRLATGLRSAQQEATRQATAETDPVRRQAMQTAAQELGTAADAAQRNQVTPDQLDHAADALFHTFAQRDAFDAQGNLVADGMNRSNIRNMERTLGLSSGGAAQTVGETSWMPDFIRSGDRQASDNLWSSIGNGQSAHVGVHSGADLSRQWEADHSTLGPNGETIQRGSDGNHFYMDEGHRVVLEHQSENHAVLFGRDASGSRYVYDPLAQPTYESEATMGRDRFDALSRSLMSPAHGPGGGEYQAPVTRYS